jgi:hypothetical protein
VDLRVFLVHIGAIEVVHCVGVDEALAQTSVTACKDFFLYFSNHVDIFDVVVYSEHTGTTPVDVID